MKGGPTIAFAVLLLAALAAVGIFVFAWPTAEPEQTAPAASSKAPAPPDSSKSATAPAPVKEAVEALKSLTDQVAPPSDRKDGPPAFDVARIEPNGEAVIGGRAAPGATVELLRGGVVHARTEADPTGEFVLIPKPLPPGSYDLTLRATQKDGKVSTSKDSVAVMLRQGGEEKPVVALAAPDKPSVVLSRPNADPSLKLVIDAVEGEAGGRMYVSGRAASGAKVNLYLNDAYIATATASKEGRIAFSIRSGIKPGDYRVRLDQVDASGRVQNRAEVPFNAPATLAGPASSGPQSTAAPNKLASASTSSDPTSAPPQAVAGAPQQAPSEQPKPSASAPRVTSVAPTTTPQPPAPQTSSGPAASQALPESAAPQTKASPRKEASTPAGAPPSSAPSETATSPQSGPADTQLATAAPSQRPATASEENGKDKKDKDSDVVVVPHVDTTVVVRGDSLWRISRSTYGEGIRYSVIYNANRDQIRDPDLIYPGQIFVLPKTQQ